MARDISELRAKMAPEIVAASEMLAIQTLLEMSLAEIREQLGQTQNDITERLKITQVAVSRMERREDMLISSLSKYIEALGGSLNLVAHFPNQRDYKIELTGKDKVRVVPC